jgi:hypothetical protein
MVVGERSRRRGTLRQWHACREYCQGWGKQVQLVEAGEPNDHYEQQLEKKGI